MIFQKTVTCLLSFQVYLQAWETNYSGVPTHLLPGEVSLYIKLNASTNYKLICIMYMNKLTHKIVAFILCIILRLFHSGHCLTPTK